MNKEWYYTQDGERIGPVDENTIIDLIKRGIIGVRCLVWCKDMKEWDIALCAGLANHFAGLPPTIPGTNQQVSSDKITITGLNGLQKQVGEGELPPFTLIPGHATHGITSIPWRIAELCTEPIKAPLRFAFKLMAKKEKANLPENWFYVVGKEWRGPFSHDKAVELIKSGEIVNNTLMWTASFDGWIPAEMTTLWRDIYSVPPPHK